MAVEEEALDRLRVRLGSGDSPADATRVEYATFDAAGSLLSEETFMIAWADIVYVASRLLMDGVTLVLVPKLYVQVGGTSRRLGAQELGSISSVIIRRLSVLVLDGAMPTDKTPLQGVEVETVDQGDMVHALQIAGKIGKPGGESPTQRHPAAARGL